MHFYLWQKPAGFNQFSENYNPGSYIVWTISQSRVSQHYTQFYLWQKPARLNQFSENYHPGSYSGLSPGHVNYLATVPIKYESGNKTSISYLYGRVKNDTPWCCGPPDELFPKVSLKWLQAVVHLVVHSTDWGWQCLLSLRTVWNSCILCYNVLQKMLQCICIINPFHKIKTL